MIMEITKNTILDLLPLYLAGEVSADTRTLMENYLASDPELAQVVKHSTLMNLPKDIPLPQAQDKKLVAFRKAKKLIILRTLILAGLMSAAVGLAILVFFLSSS
jgi:hypothetical protein